MEQNNQYWKGIEEAEKQPEFLQTAVVAAPFIADGDFDVVSSNNGFLEAFQAWYGIANSGVTSMQFAANA